MIINIINLPLIVDDTGEGWNVVCSDDIGSGM